MKEELTAKLVEILSSIQAATGKASDFALEQLPDIAQSYVTYGRVSNTLYILLFLFAAGFGIYKVVSISRNPSLDERGDWSEKSITHSVLFGFSGCLFVFFFLINLNEAVMVWVAPKVWLLKAIASLLR